MKKLKRIVKWCGAEVEMVTVDEAAWAARVSELTICRRAEAGSFHFIGDAAGRLFVCLSTLLR